MAAQQGIALAASSESAARCAMCCASAAAVKASAEGEAMEKSLSASPAGPAGIATWAKACRTASSATACKLHTADEDQSVMLLILCKGLTDLDLHPGLLPDHAACSMTEHEAGMQMQGACTGQLPRSLLRRYDDKPQMLVRLRQVGEQAKKAHVGTNAKHLDLADLRGFAARKRKRWGMGRRAGILYYTYI